MSYGEAKQALLEKIDGHFGPAREERRQLAQHPDHVEEVLRRGTQHARAEAQQTMALVREAMEGAPFSGAVFVVRAKRADRVKLIFWDGTGMVLVSKRLEDGKFRWPGVQDTILRLSAAELQALLEGLDWRRVHEPRLTAVPTATS